MASLNVFCLLHFFNQASKMPLSGSGNGTLKNNDNNKQPSIECVGCRGKDSMNPTWKLARSVVAAIDQFTEHTGRLISWLTLLLVFVVCTVVVLRYLLNIGSIAMQESAMYLHAMVFLGASAYTLKHNGHVRVDVFYRTMSPRKQALVNSLGTVFLLLPVCLFIGVMSWDYIARSWHILEQSQDPGGLPFIYLLKSLLLVMVVTLLLQGVAELMRSLMILSGASRQEGRS